MVVRLLGKIFSLLLIQAVLWAPLLFVGVYGCLIWWTDVPYSSAVMWLGAIAVWLLAIAARVALYERKHAVATRNKAAARPTNRGLIKRREPKIQIVESESPASPEPEETPEPSMPDRNGSDRYAPRADRESLAQKYDLKSYDAPAGEEPETAARQEPQKPSGTVGADAEEIFNAERERLWQRLEGKITAKPTQTAGAQSAAAEKSEDPADERPYAYASRTDPHLYIYEYADRLEFYRRMGDEMILTSTQYKTEVKRGR